MGHTPEQDGWVQRVLGVALQGATSAGGAQLAEAVSKPLRLSKTMAPPPIKHASVDGYAIWADAREAIATRFGALADALTDTNDANMRQIAIAGLPALTKRLGTRLESALIAVDAAASSADVAKSRAAARKVLDDYRNLLKQDGLIALLEDNPLSVPLEIRATLGSALDRISAAVAA